jgi:hypothetical protein
LTVWSESIRISRPSRPSTASRITLYLPLLPPKRFTNCLHVSPTEATDGNERNTRKIKRFYLLRAHLSPVAYPFLVSRIHLPHTTLGDRRQVRQMPRMAANPYVAGEGGNASCAQKGAIGFDILTALKERGLLIGCWRGGSTQSADWRRSTTLATASMSFLGSTGLVTKA